MKPEHELAIQYIPWAISLSKPYRKSFPTHQDDFKSVACMGLVQAANRFQGSRNIPFPAFARRRIRGALLDYQRSIDDVPQACQVADAVDPSPSLSAHYEATDFVLGTLQKLSPAQRQVLRSIYLDSKPLTQIADEMQVTRYKVSHLHKAGLTRLRELLDGGVSS
jgi:RNA polymerase sigma factor (sigma-70 family)